MFERFTDRARRVLVIAQEEARLFGHDYIGTEHILLGLIHEGEGVAAQALVAIGVSLDDLRAKVEEVVGKGSGSHGSPPFTPGAKKALETSLREALQLGHNYIGTEHLLLALTRDTGGVAGRVLGACGVDVSAIRDEVMRQLGGHAGGDMTAIEGDRVEKAGLPVGAGALLGSAEAAALIATWVEVEQRVVQTEVEGVTYETYTYRAAIPPEIAVAVVGAKVTKEAFAGYTRLIPDAEKVPDLGDAAAFSASRRTLRVLWGSTVIVVRVGNHRHTRDAAVEVARLALANLARATGQAYPA